MAYLWEALIKLRHNGKSFALWRMQSMKLHDGMREDIIGYLEEHWPGFFTDYPGNLEELGAVVQLTCVGGQVRYGKEGLRGPKLKGPSELDFGL
jgi:hypothetical protein